MQELIERSVNFFFFYLACRFPTWRYHRRLLDVDHWTLIGQEQ